MRPLCPKKYIQKTIFETKYKFYIQGVLHKKLKKTTSLK